MSTINSEKEKYWREKVLEAELRGTGSLVAFCRSQGVSVGGLAYWRRKFRGSEGKAVVPSKFVPIEIARLGAGLPDPRWLAAFIGELVGRVQ